MAGKPEQLKQDGERAFRYLDADQSEFLERMGIDPAEADNLLNTLHIYDELSEMLEVSAERIHNLSLRGKVAYKSKRPAKENNVEKEKNKSAERQPKSIFEELSKVLDQFNPSKSELMALGREIARRIRNSPAGKALPTAPPAGETYRRRQKRSETAPQFIDRVYGDWLTGEFTRADLGRLDPSAVTGLLNYERNYGPSGLNLPTKKERNDKIFEEGTILTDDPDETARRAAAAAYRERKLKPQ